MTDEALTDEDKLTVTPGKKSFLETLTGEGGKFYDENPDVAAEKLARGKFESDLYIKQLEARLDEMRQDFLQMKAENDSRANLEDLLDQISNTRPADTRTTPSAQEVSKPNIDLNQIESLVSRAISKNETAKKQSENWNMVKSKLVERYGDNWDAHITKQVEDLGLSTEDATALAKKSPDAFLRTFGLDQPKQGEFFQTPPRSAQNTSQFKPVTTVRNEAYYDKMRSEKPKEYYDPKTQIQLHKDAIALGEKFFT